MLAFTDVETDMWLEIVDYLLDVIEDEHCGLRGKCCDEIRQIFGVEF